MGVSGAGKSTLLNLLGGLDQPSSGSIRVGGASFSDLNEQEQSAWRNQQLGFVFQFHHLMPEFSALEAVAMPARIAGLPKAEAEQQASELLSSLGLDERLQHRPKMLSGGERQRVAIAISIVRSAY